MRDSVRLTWLSLLGSFVLGLAGGLLTGLDVLASVGIGLLCEIVMIVILLSPFYFEDREGQR